MTHKLLKSVTFTLILSSVKVSNSKSVKITHLGILKYTFLHINPYVYIFFKKHPYNKKKYPTPM